MPVNQHYLGRVFEESPPYLVGREKVREFSKSVFSTNPLNYDVDAARAAGYSDVVAPPTFCVILWNTARVEWLAVPDSGIDFARVVHGAQRFALKRPIVAGDELRTTLSVTDIKSLGANQMVTAEARFIDADDNYVGTSTSMVVVRAA